MGGGGDQMTPVSDSGRQKKRAQSRSVKTSEPRTWRTGRPPQRVVNGSPLQLLVQSRMDEIGMRDQGFPLSYQQVVDRSGGAFSKGTVGFIINGKSRNLTDETIDGLAVALELDAATIREAVRASADQQWALPARVQRLSPEAWDQLLQFADYLLTQQKRSGR